MKKIVRISKGLAFVLALLLVFNSIVIPSTYLKADAASLQIGISYRYSDNRVGNSATVTLSGAGGTKPYQYKLMYRVGNGSWITKQNFASNSKIIVPFNSAGTYTIRAYIKDKNNAQTYSQRQFSVLPKYTPLANNSTINKTVFNTGEYTTVTGKASGGNTPYKYSFYQTAFEGKRTLVQAYSSNATFSKKLPAGYYNIEALVKDADGNVKTKSFNITVKSNTGRVLSNISTMSSSKVDVNKSVSIMGKATGGVMPYEYSYAYSFDNGSTWTTISSYSRSAVKNVVLNKTGTYKIRTKVKDQTGKEAVKYLTIVSRKNTGKPLGNPTLLMDIGTSDLVDVGAKTKLTVKCDGGYLPYQYAFYYQLNTGSWRQIQGYSDKTTAEMKFPSGGNYTIRVSVKDSDGKVISSTKKVTAITTKSYSGLNKGNFTVDYGFSTDITAEDKGSGSSYAFYYKKVSGNVWTKLQDYKANRTVSFRPRYNEEYIVLVYTKRNNVNFTSTFSVKPVISDKIYKIVDLVNEERQKANLKKLEIDERLVFVAGVRAEELKQYNGHVRPDGRNWDTVLDDYSLYDIQKQFENTSRAYVIPELVVKYWMKSKEGHRENILNPSVDKCGANVCGKYWEMIYAK